jgi:nicotinamide-nucleotide amidase
MKSDAWVLTIGDELLRGEIVDSNKSFLSERLLRLDLEAERHVTVADDPEAIAEVFRAAVERTRVVLVSGGLGPTRDDITTEVAARTFGRKLVRDPVVLEGIRAFFRAVGREMAENNAKQADFPEGAEVLPNPHGTAPGFMLDVEGSLLFFMPGVPRELYAMMDEQVLPRIERSLGRGRVVRAALLRTFGLGESSLDRELTGVARDDPDVTLGFRTQFPDNLVRVVARGGSAAEAERRLDAAVEEIRALLGPLVVGNGDLHMHEIVGQLLIERGRTLAIAESCTGGLIAHRLTDVPGSSSYLLEGLVTYSNEAKVRDLGVSPADLETSGAVSEAVARQMAEGARERAGADIGIATTGIAGPSGGTEEKPVGTVFIAYADADGTIAHRYQLMRDRQRNKELAAHMALDWLRRRLLGLEIPRESFPRLRGLGTASAPSSVPGSDPPR